MPATEKRQRRVSLNPQPRGHRLSWLNLLGIAVGLAMDAFAVSIAACMRLKQVTFRHIFRLAWHFGLFQFMMPIIGWWAGSTVSAFISHYDHWIACVLLTFIGGKMLYEAGSDKKNENMSNPTKGWMLVTLSVATSIDALAVGLSLAFLRIDILFPSVVIGIVALLFTAVGITFGARILGQWGRIADILGGVVLIAIGIRILISHVG